MAATDVEICNLALARIATKALLYTLGDGTAEANACAQFYPQSRDLLLSSFPWPFATRRTTLVVAAGETRSDWDYVYSLPTDCLVARFIHPGTRQVPYNMRIPYAIEAASTNVGRVLCTDQESAELVYTARITDVPSYSPEFVDTLAWLIASELAMPLAVDPRQAANATQRLQMALANAGGIQFRQSQEDPPTRIEGEYVRARGNLPAQQ